MSSFNDFCKCKWYSKGDPTNVWSLGYCHCPERQPKPPAIALIHCLGTDCGYYASLYPRTFTITTSVGEEKKEMTNVEKIVKLCRDYVDCYDEMQEQPDEAMCRVGYGIHLMELEPQLLKELLKQVADTESYDVIKELKKKAKKLEQIRKLVNDD